MVALGMKKKQYNSTTQPSQPRFYRLSKLIRLFGLLLSKCLSTRGIYPPNNTCFLACMCFFFTHTVIYFFYKFSKNLQRIYKVTSWLGWIKIYFVESNSFDSGLDESYINTHIILRINHIFLFTFLFNMIEHYLNILKVVSQFPLFIFSPLILVIFSNELLFFFL